MLFSRNSWHVFPITWPVPTFLSLLSTVGIPTCRNCREFLPEGDLLLGELHVIADEEALRVLPLAVGHDAAVEFGDGWQPAGNTKSHSQSGGEARQPQQQGKHIKSASALTLLENSCQEAQALIPLRERGKFRVICREHSKFNIFISPQICTTRAQIRGRLAKSPEKQSSQI